MRVSESRSGQRSCRIKPMLDVLAKRPPMGSIAQSHHMAGDARPCLELRGVFLNEANSTLPEIPTNDPPVTRRNLINFIVIMPRSRQVSFMRCA